MNNKIYPIGIQSFEKIRKDGYAYVDKTALIYQLVKSGSCFFLSRPRHFGKSLLTSTLEAYFRGKQDLFKGLAMERLEQEWIESPVLHLDFSIGKYDTLESLEKVLNDTLTDWEKSYGSCPSETTFALRFAGIMKRAVEKTGHRIVFLVDDFDKPMLQAIAKESLQSEYSNILKPFYGVLKTMDNCTKFVLLTSVTKLGKTSILSNLNKLNDISIGNQFSTLCGMTEKELHTQFDDSIHKLSDAQNLIYEEVCHKLKQCYGGYRFAQSAEEVYNPFSLINAFYKMTFGNYCLEAGAPIYLAELLKRNRYKLEQILPQELNEATLNDDQLLSIVFQSGCLTLKEYNKEKELYYLGFPNREIEEGFYKLLMPVYTRFNRLEAPAEIMRFVRDIERGQPEAFLRRLQSFFAGTSQPLKQAQELQYQNILFITFKLVSFCIQAEYHIFEGGMNLQLKTTDYIYIMEFKLEGTSEEALKQIEAKQYAAAFKSDSRQLFRIGLNFSGKTQGIGRWLIE